MRAEMEVDIASFKAGTAGLRVQNAIVRVKLADSRAEKAGTPRGVYSPLSGSLYGCLIN